MRRKKRKYRKKNKPKSKINHIVVVIIMMMIVGATFIKIGYDFEKNTTPIYQYIIKKSNNYEVLLKENEFYETKILPSGRLLCG